MRASSLLLSISPLVSAFTHPGLLVADQDIDRAKEKIAAGEDPWLSSWNKLTSLVYSSASYTNNAVSNVSRIATGDYVANADLLWHDAAAAFNLALRWKISGNTSYADTAAKILVAWGETLESIGGADEAYLLAGLQGYELANAGELLRDYAPFAENGLSTFSTMLANIFLPMNIDFLNHVLGSEHNVKHFFANWELANLASALAIAVLNDNQTAWDFSIDYFKNGVGNGAVNNAITNIVEEPGTGKPLGQGQESGRDQGHSALDFQLLAAIGQQGWNQGEDLFGYNDSRILRGAEYFARYNLGNDVPFEPYTNGIVSYTNISSASRGAIRPTWELLYNHYVNVKGVEAPWTADYLNKTLDYFGGFEGGAGSWGEGSGHYDGLGWGSLLYHQDGSENATSSSNLATSTSVSSRLTVSVSTSTHSSASTVSTTSTEPSTSAQSSTSIASPISTSSSDDSSTIIVSPISTTLLTIRVSSTNAPSTSSSSSTASISASRTTPAPHHSFEHQPPSNSTLESFGRPANHEQHGCL